MEINKEKILKEVEIFTTPKNVAAKEMGISPITFSILLKSRKPSLNTLCLMNDWLEKKKQLVKE